MVVVVRIVDVVACVVVVALVVELLVATGATLVVVDVGGVVVSVDPLGVAAAASVVAASGASGVARSLGAMHAETKTRMPTRAKRCVAGGCLIAAEDTYSSKATTEASDSLSSPVTGGNRRPDTSRVCRSHPADPHPGLVPTRT